MVQKVHILLAFLLLCFTATSYRFPSQKTRFSRTVRQKANLLFDMEAIMGTMNLYLPQPDSGLVSDMVVAACLSAVSDGVAQLTESTTPIISTNSSSPKFIFPYDYQRTKRFLLFGFLDGAFGHSWFYILERFIRDNQVIDILRKIAADSLLYTPIWCVWFICVMTWLENGHWRGLFDILKKNWFSLFRLSTS
jgi:hypothetical protein